MLYRWPVNKARVNTLLLKTITIAISHIMTPVIMALHHRLAEIWLHQTVLFM